MININPYRFALGGQTPSLDLQFVNQNLTNVTTGTSPVTFTRASTGTFVGSNGLLQTAATNAPRFNCNPLTGACLGLLIEEQRTNSIRNNTMVGAVAGTPGTAPTNWLAATPANGITRQIVGTGTENGISYIDFRFSGTNTLGSGFYMDIAFDSGVIAAAQGQAWTESIYAKLVAGSVSGASFSTSPRLRLYELPSFTSSELSLEAVSSAELGSQRFAFSRTLTGVTTTGVSPRIAWLIATGATIDFTLRIGMPQLELGAFATSVIPTTTAAATRSADVAQITGTNFSSWYRQDEGTLFAEVGYQQNNLTSTQMAASFNDTTANNRWTAAFGSTGTGVMLRNTGGAGLVSTSTSNAATVGATNKIAVAISTGASLVLNGGTVATNASYAAPTVTQLELGRHLGAGYFNGHLRRITYWPTRLPNAGLQQITT